MLDELARKSGEAGEIRPHVSIVRDEIDSVRVMAENALLHRHDPGTYRLDEGAREYRGMTLMEIGRDLLERRGVRSRGLSKSEVAGAMLGLETRGGLHSTSDFPLILANVANKTLRSAYEAAPQTFKGFSRQTSNPDFKTIARTQLGDAGVDMRGRAGARPAFFSHVDIESLLSAKHPLCAVKPLAMGDAGSDGRRLRAALRK